MEKNIIGQLLILKTMNVKPNFSKLSRTYGIDRHTIKKYYQNGGIVIKEKKKRKCKLDKYIEDIESQFKKKGVSKKGAYEFIKEKYPNEDIGSYSTFRHFTLKQQLLTKKEIVAHVRFETPIGKQLQNDWKENIVLHDRSGKEYVFNILSSTLGYSRLHVFVYSTSKTTESYLRCVIDTLNKLGGCPKEILTDNMAAIVSIKNGSKHKHQKIINFEKDTGIPIKLCKTRSPETKGKDESANRFINWLNSYDGEFDNEEELIDIINRLNIKVNMEVNQTTNIPPITLFEKEKEYLTPLPNKVLLDNYVDISFTKVVPQTLLIDYKGNGYSVPKRFIGKAIKVYLIDDKLHFYYNNELICIHKLSNNKFNYRQEDYKEALVSTIKSKDIEIDKIVEDNLKAFDKMKGK